LYNLALFAIKRGELEIARGHLSKALARTPHDIETKVNLELVIRMLKAKRKAMSTPGAAEKKAPQEQWRDFPALEGDSASETGRSYL
jgi:hypothetical protein